MASSQPKSFNLVLMQIIGPALIIVMVASLVFFLIEVFYRGPHVGRLYWIMALFTFASVLVSRVSIEEGKERAFLLGFLLAVATFVTCSQLIEFRYAGLSFLSPLVIIGLIAIVMWSSSKLTWDCTVVDRSRDPSATGLVDLLQNTVQDEIASVQNADDKTNWFLKWLSGKPKKNNPGLWVMYFAVFAFPVFGFGQWFVESADKWWTYVLFAVYLAATLSLLMTTSLLGLERYLAKRQLSVPAPIARNWLLTGGTFALLVMLIVIFIPKPPSAGWSNDLVAMLQSPFKDGSDWAPGKDNHKNDPEAKKQRVDKNGEKQSDKPGDDAQSGDAKEKGDGKQSKDSGDSKNSNDKENNQNQDQSKNAQSPENKSKSKQRSDSKDPTKADQQNRKQNNARQNNQQRNKNRNAQNKNQQSNKLSDSISRVFESISGIFRAFIYLVGVVAVLVLIYMFRDQIMALFAKETEAKHEEAPIKTPPAKKQPSFPSFQNPFQSGRAAKMPTKDVVDYTKNALEAWARDLGIQQGSDDTPEELANRTKQIDVGVAKYAKRLAELYGKIAFSGNDNVSREELKPLIKLWQKMASAYKVQPAAGTMVSA